MSQIRQRPPLLQLLKYLVAQSMGSRCLYPPSVANYNKPYDTHMLHDFDRRVLALLHNIVDGDAHVLRCM